jgi:hypothetical protein
MPILTRPGCIGKVLRCDININVSTCDKASVELHYLCVSSLGSTGFSPDAQGCEALPMRRQRWGEPHAVKAIPKTVGRRIPAA